jgi:predicted secreted protein
MNIFSGIVVYVLIWWMVFFCALPFGIKNIEKPKDGAMPGAPIDPGLKRKLVITTAIAVVIWLAAYALITSNLVSFHAMAQRMAM